MLKINCWHTFLTSNRYNFLPSFPSLTWQSCRWPGWFRARSASQKSASRVATASGCTGASAPETCDGKNAACGSRTERGAAGALGPRGGCSWLSPACPAGWTRWRAGCSGWTAVCRPRCTRPKRSGWERDPSGWCRRRSSGPTGGRRQEVKSQVSN